MQLFSATHRPDHRIGPMKPPALIFGGRGFVGQHLARQLSDRYVVVVSGRTEDIRDAATVLKLIEATAPKIVVNLAASTTVAETVQDPRSAYEVGLFGLLNVFEALSVCEFEGRILQVSSSEVYGFPTVKELPLKETAQLRPMSPYSVAKITGEMLCHQWSLGSPSPRLDISVARPFTHIGPGQSDRFAVARFSKQIARIVAKRREPILRVGNLSATRDLTDVRDVVRAYDLILHLGERGHVYNVCSSREAVMRDVLDELVRISGLMIEIVEEPILSRKLEQQRMRGCHAKLTNLTGWTPKISLSQTLTDILQDNLANSDPSKL
jgi:GDP-4-dehydro-6-deoxy-D-mannose reductase